MVIRYGAYLTAVLLAGLGVYFGVRNLWAWHHFRAGQQALEQGHFVQARAHLLLCLEVWPKRAETHLLLARTARRAGNYHDAQRHLECCQQEQGSAEAIRLEEALLHAQRGELPSLPNQPSNPSKVEISLRDPPAEMSGVRDYLLGCIANDHPDKALILEALAQGYLSNERTVSALYCVEQLLQCRPDDVQGLLWHGELKEHYDEPQAALADYRRAVELNPGHEEARLHLAESLLQAGQTLDALEHFQRLHQRQQGDPEALLGVARCRRDLGQFAQAGQLLDQLLAAESHYVPALIERGRLAQRTGQAADAERWLRQAVTLQPYNRQANYHLCLCLQQLGKEEEVKTIRTKLKRLDADRRRLEEVTRQIAQTPHDPAPRYEAGVILLRSGQEQKGISCLAAALQEDPKHGPTLQALADYYERVGQPALAARYRKLEQ